MFTLRRLLFTIARPLVQIKTYHAAGRATHGWRAVATLPFIGVLAFQDDTTDGWQFSW
jgi:hypothetical protein